jgi:predicted permease
MLVHDFRYALRGLFWNPGFTLVAAGSLALAIGGSMTVFTILNAVVLRSLPVHEPQRVFEAVRATADETVGRFAWPSIERAKRELGGRAEIAAASNIAGMQLAPQGVGPLSAERGFVQLVSGEYFELMRQLPQHGRLLTPSDNQSVGAHPVAVISDSFWRRQFAASADAVGRTLTINGAAFTVVGVTRPQFFGTTVAARTPDVWIPLMMQSAVRYAQNASRHDGADTNEPWPPQETIEWLSVFVRVPPGTASSTIAAALTVQRQREALSIFSGERFATLRQTVQNERILLTPASRGLSPFRDTVASSLFVLLAMMGVLLAIACGNVAGLLLARASAREREMAIRLSIGAGRMQLVRQTLTESLLLGLIAGGLGVLLAFWSRDALLKMLVPAADLINIDVGFDLRVLTVALGVSLATGIVCGVLPALRGNRLSLAAALKDEAHLSGRRPGSRSVGRALVMLQMAFCLLALVVAGLFVQSLRSLTSIDIGFDRESVLTARVDVRSLGYTAEQRQALYARILERMRSIPGVTSASLSLNGPLAGGVRSGSFAVEGYTPNPTERLDSHSEIVTRDYFETVGLRLLAGRPFGLEDQVMGSRNTIVNETIARRFFNGADAVGKRWDFGTTVGADGFVIVGVVEDAKYVDLRARTPNMVYQLADAEPAQVLSDLEIRTSGSLAGIAPAVRRALAESEPQLPVFDLVPLTERMGRRMAQDTLIAQLTSVFSGFALFLACLGLYGTVSYGINRRIPEIALRMALGANRRSVLGMILHEALFLAVAGAAAGIPLSIVAARGVRAMLYETSPLDPVAYGAAALLLIAVSAVAALLPARRASQIEAAVALNRS